MASNNSVRKVKGGKRGFSAAAMAIIAAVVAVEGGFVDHPSDPGGATNWGITEAVARQHGYAGDMRALPKEEAKRIYAESYIRAPGFEPIVDDAPGLGKKIVDAGVNAGSSRSGRWFQESLNHFNERGRVFPDIVEDGRVGPKTIAAWELLKRRRGKRLACELVLKAVDAKQAGHYMRLAASWGGNSQFEDFMVGWFRTRIQNVPLAECVG